jgi:UDP-glucuronate decarboxylase
VSTNAIIAEDCAAIAAALRNPGFFREARVLVTGCAGFLGYTFMQFFARHARELGIAQITGLDNFMLGASTWLDDLARNEPRLSIRSFDVAHTDLASIPEAATADVIIHMASIASPTYYRQYPIETLDANVWGLRRLLDYYRERKIRGLLFFSSSEIYGDPDPARIPTDEEYLGNVSCIGPRACYDEAKRIGETMCYLFAKQFGMPITVVRPFNNYGPGMRLTDRRLPADVIRSVYENRDIVLHSDGSPTRTFCYVSDAVTGYLLALAHGQFDYFNIGTAKPEISVRAFSELCAEAGRKLCGYTGKVRLEKAADAEYLSNNPMRRCPSIAKAQRVLGYQPQVPVEAGVERFLKFNVDGGSAL